MTTASNPLVLLLDDDTSSRDRLAEALKRRGLRVTKTERSCECLQRLADGSVQWAVVEPNLVGTSWFRVLQSVTPHARRVLILTDFPSRAMAAEAQSLGILGVLRKPACEAKIADALQGASAGWSPPIRNSRSLAAHEWEYINQVIRDCEGNLSEAARLLEIPRQTIYRKLRKLPPL